MGLVLFPVGLATHEVMHLAVYSAMGYRAALLVTQWRLGTTDVQIFGLHAAPLDPPTVPVGLLVTNNLLGPLLAAMLLLIIRVAAGSGASRALRAALLGNVLALLFFAGIEAAYPLLESLEHIRADVLLLPELNYGGVLLLLAAAAALPSRAAGGPRVRMGGPATVSR